MLRYGRAGINMVDETPLQRNIFVQSRVFFFIPLYIMKLKAALLRCTFLAATMAAQEQLYFDTEDLFAAGHTVCPVAKKSLAPK
jgi:hypothetical protein